MAFTEFYCQSTGSNLNAGSTTDAAAVHSYAGGTFVRSTGVFTCASGNPLTDGVAVGNWASIYTTAGATVATYVALVTGRDATTITVSLTAKSGVTTSVSESAGEATCKVGGAWLGPNAAVGFPFNFVQNTMVSSAGVYPRVNLKNTTAYAITAKIAVANPGPAVYEGYSSAPGDADADASKRATISATVAGTGITIIEAATGAHDVEISNLVLAESGATSGGTYILDTSTNSAVRWTIRRVSASGGAEHGFNVGGCVLEECEAFGNNTRNLTGFAGFYIGAACTAIRCVAHDNAGDKSVGFYLDGNYGISLIDCIADRNGKYGINDACYRGTTLVGCTVYKNGSDGIYRSYTAGYFLYENCVCELNGGYGVNFVAAITSPGSIINLHTYLNSGGATNAVPANCKVIGSVAEGASSFADMTGNRPTVGNFRPIAGSSARNGARTRFIQETATNYTSVTASARDAGASQHADPTLPSINDVTYATAFGDGGTEYLGNFVVPGPTNVKSGVGYASFDGANYELTGEYAGGGGTVIVIED
jgi:hypothetical protein